MGMICAFICIILGSLVGSDFPKTRLTLIWDCWNHDKTPGKFWLNIYSMCAVQSSLQHLFKLSKMYLIKFFVIENYLFFLMVGKICMSVAVVQVLVGKFIWFLYSHVMLDFFLSICWADWWDLNILNVNQNLYKEKVIDSNTTMNGKRCLNNFHYQIKIYRPMYIFSVYPWISKVEILFFL